MRRQAPKVGGWAKSTLSTAIYPKGAMSATNEPGPILIYKIMAAWGFLSLLRLAAPREHPDLVLGAPHGRLR